MCVNPRLMSNGVSVACRKCWQCNANYMNDWVGRCIAESKTAVASNFVTLTYGRDEDGNSDHVRTAVLTYTDVQSYLKKLRTAGFPVRYFSVGEFGSAKGRAHWHMLLFWQERVPAHDLRVRFNQEHWKHGFSEWDECNAASIRYVCKYIQKDLSDAERQRQVNMSKYPPLGARYFDILARRYVEQGIAPREPSYSFPDVKDKSGKIVQFWMRGATLDNFVAAFEREWAEKRGGHAPVSDLLIDYADRIAEYQPPLQIEPYKPGGGRPWIDPPSPMYFSDSRNAWVCDHDGVLLYWSFDSRGKRAWQSVLRTESQADLLRETYEQRKLLGDYRQQSRGE